MGASRNSHINVPWETVSQRLSWPFSYHFARACRLRYFLEPQPPLSGPSPHGSCRITNYDYGFSGGPYLGKPSHQWEWDSQPWDDNSSLLKSEPLALARLLSIIDILLHTLMTIWELSFLIISHSITWLYLSVGGCTDHSVSFLPIIPCPISRR